jgi:pimeloyl-ACP methyl ester carboxylesterase
MFRFMPATSWHNGRGWDFQIWRLASQAHYGGGHLSEMARVIERLKPDDAESWYAEWRGLGNQLSGMADEARAAGHHRTASDRLLRASNYYRVAEFFLHIGDPRKDDVYATGVRAFRDGIDIGGRPVKAVTVPFEDVGLKGYWCEPTGRSPGRPRTIVFIGGLDSTAEELYFTGYGLLERGYRILIVEGPGQGGVLRDLKLPSRFDYEVVGTAAYEWVVGQAGVDANRVALVGMSLGGYYSLRIAAFEHRFCALVSWSPIENYYQFWQDRPDTHNLAPHVMWVLGAQTMVDARAKMKAFNVSDVVGNIRCPTLLCVAEMDGSPISLQQARSVYEKLTCPRTWAYFTQERVGVLHCEQDHLTLANEVIGDWLDNSLGDA